MAKSGYSVGKGYSKRGVFRDVRSGAFVTRVMDGAVFNRASERASEVIRTRKAEVASTLDHTGDKKK